MPGRTADPRREAGGGGEGGEVQGETSAETPEEGGRPRHGSRPGAAVHHYVYHQIQVRYQDWDLNENEKPSAIVASTRTSGQTSSKS